MIKLCVFFLEKVTELFNKCLKQYEVLWMFLSCPHQSTLDHLEGLSEMSSHLSNPNNWWIFPDLLLLLTFSLISLCSEVKLYMISILWNLFQFVLWTRKWIMLVNVPHALQKNVCSSAIFDNVAVTLSLIDF